MSVTDSSCLASVLASQVVLDVQRIVSTYSNSFNGHPLSLPRIDYAEVRNTGEAVPPPEHMTLHSLHSSGPSNQTIDLTFFSDGCELLRTLM